MQRTPRHVPGVPTSDGDDDLDVENKALVSFEHCLGSCLEFFVQSRAGEPAATCSSTVFVEKFIPCQSLPLWRSWTFASSGLSSSISMSRSSWGMPLSLSPGWVWLGYGAWSWFRMALLTSAPRFFSDFFWYFPTFFSLFLIFEKMFK